MSSEIDEAAVAAVETPPETAAFDAEELVVGLDALSAAVVPAEVTVRSLAKREVDMRIVPFDTTVETVIGPEMFARGSFQEIDPSKVLLMGLEHEAHIGLSQDGKPMLVRRPIGKGTALSESDDGAHMTFRVAQTPAGDEYLALASEGVVSGASVEIGKNARVSVETRSGRRTSVVRWADLRAVSPTYRPAYAEAGVLAVRSQKEDAPVATEDKAPEAGATAVEDKPEAKEPEVTQFRNLMSAIDGGFDKVIERFSGRIESLEERARSAFNVPTEAPQTPDIKLGDWSRIVFQMLSGDRIPDSQYRTVADLITTDNAGIVPEAYISEIRGVIDASRPFMQTTRRLPTPSGGTSLRVPKITQRPTVAEQTAEKTELSSQKTIITSDTFEMVTKGGVGDLSLQLLKRSDPSFLDLYIRLLAEALALEADDEAVHELIDAIGSVGSATALDPEALVLGPAFQTSFDAIRRPPDTIWLSTEALAAFIDAKASTTNQPMYSNIVTNMTAGNPVQGSISGLRVVHVPALDAHGAYAIVGPSSGFAWAEDGSYTLQVDVPSKAGRDVALVSMFWFVPWYPDAFSLYNVAS